MKFIIQKEIFDKIDNSKEYKRICDLFEESLNNAEKLYLDKKVKEEIESQREKCNKLISKIVSKKI